MPRKTLALIIGLVLVTVVLFVIAIRTNNDQKTTEVAQQPTSAVAPEPTSVAHTTLTLGPNPVTVGTRQQGTVDVNIDTSENAVTAVELDLSYDPAIITNVKIVPGPLFPNPVILKDGEEKPGQYKYAIGIQPNQATIQGTGSVATITFTARGTAGQQSQLTLLPSSLVTARGVSPSVLKGFTGTTVVIGTPNRAQ